jgi:Muconolactone delta-isomerase
MIQNLLPNGPWFHFPGQEVPAMEFLVTITTHVPEGTPEQAVEDVRAREAARSRELAAQGHLRRLWHSSDPVSRA